MTENSLVISGDDLAVDAFTEWFAERVCCLSRCTKLCDSRNEFLVELALENELDVALSRFGAHFKSAVARRATSADAAAAKAAEQAAEAEDENVTLAFRLGDPAGACGAASPPPRCVAFDVALTVRRLEGGGTGARLWSGGVLLAEWLARGATVQPDVAAELGGPLPGNCVDLQGKDVLELGAGAAALPSAVAARLGARRVLASDAVAEVLAAMRRNVAAANAAARADAPEAAEVAAEALDWAVAGRKTYCERDRFDVILFADAIYTERGGFLLADAILSLLRPGGIVVGALPDFRLGLQSFEEDMLCKGFLPLVVELDGALLRAASRAELRDTPDLALASASLEGYRILIWRDGG